MIFFRINVVTHYDVGIDIAYATDFCDLLCEYIDNILLPFPHNNYHTSLLLH